MSPYEELETPAALRADCRAASRQLARTADRAVHEPGGPHVAGDPRRGTERGIEVSETAQRVANALHLHLD